MHRGGGGGGGGGGGVVYSEVELDEHSASQGNLAPTSPLDLLILNTSVYTRATACWSCTQQQAAIETEGKLALMS